MLDSRRRPWWLQPRTLNLAGFVWCAALVGYALYAEHVLGDVPCPLCILQRIAVMATGALFLLAWVINPAGRGLRRLLGTLIVIVAGLGIAVALRQVYVINAPAGSVAECGASLDYMMDVLPLHEVLGKVLSGSGECAKVTWRFLGLTMPAWVIVNLVGLAALGALANLRKR